MEIWDLYDESRLKTGEQMIRGNAVPKGRYHIVVHVCIFGKDGKMIIQQRQPFKEDWSGMWDVTVGGSALAGEDSRTAAEREVSEEIGYPISLKNDRPFITIHVENAFDDIWCVRRDIELSDLKLQYEEVKMVKRAAMDDIFKMIDNEEFIPYNKSLIELMFHFSDKRGTIRSCYGTHLYRKRKD